MECNTTCNSRVSAAHDGHLRQPQYFHKTTVFSQNHSFLTSVLKLWFFKNTVVFYYFFSYESYETKMARNNVFTAFLQNQKQEFKNGRSTFHTKLGIIDFAVCARGTELRQCPFRGRSKAFRRSIRNYYKNVIAKLITK